MIQIEEGAPTNFQEANMDIVRHRRQEATAELAIDTSKYVMNSSSRMAVPTPDSHFMQSPAANAP